MRYNEIVVASTRLISEKGYNGASIQEICDTVGIHKSTFFHYFKNKEELLFTILKTSMTEVDENIQLIVDSKSMKAEEKLKMAIANHIIRLGKFRDNVNIFLSDLKFLPDEKRERYFKMRKHYAGCFVKIIEKIQEEGGEHFASLDAKIVAYAILGMCNWTVKWFNQDGLLNPEKIADIYYQVISQECSLGG